MIKQKIQIRVVIHSMVALFCCLLSIPSFASETVSVYSRIQNHHKAFIIFYMSRCIHCRRFEPVLNAYAQNHQMPVLSYTLDGKTLPGFDKSFSPNQSELNRFFPDHHPVVPTVFLVDLVRHTIKPVLRGEANADQLDRRMSQLTARDTA